MNVYEKLQSARIELQSTKMKKSGHNKFAGYQYFELGDFLPEINKIFSKLGLCSAVSFGKELAELKVINIEKPDEVVTFTSPMADANLKGCHPIQNLGAVETYSRRYLYVTALEIVEHDALDSAPPVDSEKKAPMPKGVIKPTSGAGEGLTQEQVKKVNEAVKKVTDWLLADSVEDAVLEKWNAELDADESVYFWTFFDSKQRSAMTKEFERQKQKNLKQNEGAQA